MALQGRCNGRIVARSRHLTMVCTGELKGRCRVTTSVTRAIGKPLREGTAASPPGALVRWGALVRTGRTLQRCPVRIVGRSHTYSTKPSYLELDELTLYHGLKLARLLEVIRKRRASYPIYANPEQSRDVISPAGYQCYRLVEEVHRAEKVRSQFLSLRQIARVRIFSG